MKILQYAILTVFLSSNAKAGSLADPEFGTAFSCEFSTQQNADVDGSSHTKSLKIWFSKFLPDRQSFEKTPVMLDPSALMGAGKSEQIWSWSPTSPCRFGLIVSLPGGQAKILQISNVDGRALSEGINEAAIVTTAGLKTEKISSSGIQSGVCAMENLVSFEDFSRTGISQ